MNKIKSIFETEDHINGLIYRLTLGIVILPHGCQFLLGWFGGFGFNASINYFTHNVGLPWFIGFLVIMLQSLGALLILLGLGGRIMALSTVGLFIGMILTNHLQHGFFMNWLGDKNGEGYEFHLLVIGLAIALLFKGSGKFSFDYWLTKNNITTFKNN